MSLVSNPSNTRWVAQCDGCGDTCMTQPSPAAALTVAHTANWQPTLAQELLCIDCAAGRWPEKVAA